MFGRIDGSVGRVSSCTADASRIALVYSHDLGNGQTAVRYGIVPHLASPPEI